MNQYVFHDIEKNTKIFIIPPTIEEILDDNFNYSDYIEQNLIKQVNSNDYTKKQFYQEFLDEEIPSRSPLDDALIKNGLLQSYENEIITIQKQYEESPKGKSQSLNYNEAMKQIAQKYYEQLKPLIKFKLQKENEHKALIIKHMELLSVIKQVVEVKSSIESTSENRLNDFINKKIPLGKIYIYDLIHIPHGKLSSHQKKFLNKVKRQVFSNLQDQEGIYYKPISELHFKRNTK